MNNSETFAPAGRSSQPHNSARSPSRENYEKIVHLLHDWNLSWASDEVDERMFTRQNKAITVATVARLDAKQFELALSLVTKYKDCRDRLEQEPDWLVNALQNLIDWFQ